MEMDLLNQQQTKEAQENLESIRALNKSYQNVFLTPEGRKVLRNLINLFLGYHEDEEIADEDTNMMYYNLGKQKVIFYILSRLFKERIDLLTILNEIAIIEHTEHNEAINNVR